MHTACSVQFDIVVKQGKLANAGDELPKELPDDITLNQVTELNGCTNQVWAAAHVT